MGYITTCSEQYVIKAAAVDKRVTRWDVLQIIKNGISIQLDQVYQ